MKAICIGYLTFFIGMSVSSVGQTPTPIVYTWSLPVSVALVLGIAARLGYLAGREDQ